MGSSADRSRTYGGKPLSVRRAERRTSFLSAGLEVFGGKGYSSSSITDLCASAGLARSQFYAEFDSRETLLIAVYEMIQSDARTAVGDAFAALPESTDLDETISAVMTALLDSLGSDPRRSRICYIEMLGVSPRVEEYRAARRQVWMDFISETLENAIGDDAVSPGGYKVAAWAFLGALTEIGLQWSLSRPRPPLSELVNVLTAMLRGLLPAEAVVRSSWIGRRDIRTDKLDFIV
jgi:AcrR family transcriptional regulator